LLLFLSLHLHGTHPPQSFFSFDAFFFAGLQHFLVFDAEFTTLDVEAIESDHNCVGIFWRTEISKGKTAKGACRI
jgi:hypothetical protein